MPVPLKTASVIPLHGTLCTHSPSYLRYTLLQMLEPVVALRFFFMPPCCRGYLRRRRRRALALRCRLPSGVADVYHATVPSERGLPDDMLSFCTNICRCVQLTPTGLDFARNAISTRGLAPLLQCV